MLDVSSSTLEALEFPALLRLLAELTATDVGAAAVSGLGPAADLDDLDVRRERFEETRLLLVDGPLVRDLTDAAAPLLERLRDGRAALDGGDVLQAADVLRVAQDAAGRLRQATEPPCARLTELFAGFPDSGDWIRLRPPASG